jgi:HSP20 family molecular chaperone IbpA
VKPVYEVKETADAYGLTVFLPAVTRENLEITAEEGQFRIFATHAWKKPDGWTPVYRESSDAPYELVLTHENLIDTDKVVAELKDGVLRVSLPKHEAAKPRKIAVS